MSSLLARALFSLLGATMLATALLTAGCVIEPREGLYDRDHHRWYHEHAWRECGEHCHD